MTGERTEGPDDYVGKASNSFQRLLCRLYGEATFRGFELVSFATATRGETRELDAFVKATEWQL